MQFIDESTIEELSNVVAYTLKAETQSDGSVQYVVGTSFLLTTDTAESMILIKWSDLKSTKGETGHYILEPVYEPYEYQYQINQSDGAVKTATAAAGTADITIPATTAPEGYDLSYWTGYYNTLTFTSDQYDNVTIVENNDKKAFTAFDLTDPELKFKMPKGNTYISAINKYNLYTVTVTDGARITDNDNSYKPGETVTLRPYSRSDGKTLKSWKAVDDAGNIVSLDVKTIYYGGATEGKVARYTFEMPACNVTLSPVYEDGTTHTLTLKINADGVGSEEYLLDANDGFMFTPDSKDSTANYYEIKSGTLLWAKSLIPDGYMIESWDITPANASEDVMKSFTGDAGCEFVMPNCDVTVVAKYTGSAPTPTPEPTPEPEPSESNVIDKVDLSLIGDLSGGENLPVSADVKDDRIVDDYASISWTDTDGTMASSPALFNSTYIANFYISAKDGYTFDDDSKVYLDGMECKVVTRTDDYLVLKCDYATDKAIISNVESEFYVYDILVGTKESELGSDLSEFTMMTIGDYDIMAKVTWDVSDSRVITDTNGEYSYLVYGTATPLEDMLEDIGVKDGVYSYASGLSNRIVAKIATLKAGEVGSPHLSSDSPRPGTYTEDKSVALHVDKVRGEERSSIYYYIETGSDNTISSLDESSRAAMLRNIGTKYSSDSGYITIPSADKVSTTSRIWAVAQSDESYTYAGSEVDKGKFSNVVSFEYTIDKTGPKKYNVTVINGSGSGSYKAGSTVNIAANNAGNMAIFKGFELMQDIDVTIADSSKSRTSFTMPDEDVVIIANYEIYKAIISLDNPVAGKTLTSTATLSNLNSSAIDQMKTGLLDVTYYNSNGDEVTGDAAYNTTYTISMSATLHNSPGYTFSEDAVVYLNGSSAGVFVTSKGLFIVDEEKTEKAKITKAVNKFGLYGIDAGVVETQLAALLPKTTTITLLGKEITAEIVWDLSNDRTVSYSDDNDNVYVLKGTIKLNADILATLGLTEDDVEYASGLSSRVVAYVRNDQVTDDYRFNVYTHDGAPSASSSMTLDDIIRIIVTDDEREAVSLGATLRIWADFTAIDNSIDAAAREAIEAAANGWTIGRFIDVSLYKKLSGDDEATKITETKEAVSFSMVIPDDMLNAAYEYCIVRYHDGVAEIIESTYDETTHTITFASDKFSEYAIGYKVSDNSSAKTGDVKDIAIWILIAILASISAGYITVRRREDLIK